MFSDFVVVGVSLLVVDVEVWTVELIKEQIKACYAEWERYKRRIQL